MFEADEEFKKIVELGRKEMGIEKPTLAIRNISNIIDSLVKELGLQRIWVLIDEWSDVPITLQPFLAELIKKILLPIRTVVVKIAAIEHRSSFRIKTAQGIYVGMELGADIMADICLDDFLVFENNTERSVQYFKRLFYNHLKSIMGTPELLQFFPLTADEMVSTCFASSEAFQELVWAAEGVPRDAINILGNSVQLAFEDKISITNVREAARRWYERDKLNAVSADERAAKMLIWIFEQVIGTRRAKAFIVETNLQNKEIDFLFDQRVLHVLKRAISAKDTPGKRYMVYGIDYGCYVDLLTTSKRPLGFLLLEDEEDAPLYSEIPKTDMRSVRRSILIVDDFETYYRSM
jgi:hypothetical protein